MPPERMGKKRGSSTPLDSAKNHEKNQNDHPSSSDTSNPRKKRSKTSKAVINNKPRNLISSDSDVPESEGEYEKIANEQVKVPENSSNKKLKPIIVDATYKSMLNLIETSNHLFSKKPSMAIKGANKVQVFCHSLDDKNAFITNLKAKSYVFHSFAEQNEKKKVFVLKGYFYENDLTNMCKEFQEAGIKCSKVSFISKNEDYPIYLVHFDDPKTTVIALNQQHREINGLLIKWKPKIKSSTRPTQCYNCQLYGHAASNCHRPYRCVKCTEQHEPGQCKRTTREGHAACVNCKGQHPANSVECPQYKKYTEIITKRRTTQTISQNSLRPTFAQTVRQSQHQQHQTRQQWSAQPRLAAAAAAPDIYNNNNFPYLSQQNNVNRVDSQVSESSLNKLPSFQAEFFSLQKELLEIPKIEESLLKIREIIDQLKQTDINDTNARTQILLKFMFNVPLLNSPSTSPSADMTMDAQ
jgi:hypothetical protein